MLVDESHRTTSAVRGPDAPNVPDGMLSGIYRDTPAQVREEQLCQIWGAHRRLSIDQAVKDKAVVPALYEGRLVEMEQNKNAIDTWLSGIRKV